MFECLGLSGAKTQEGCSSAAGAAQASQLDIGTRVPSKMRPWVACAAHATLTGCMLYYRVEAAHQAVLEGYSDAELASSRLRHKATQPSESGTNTSDSSWEGAPVWSHEWIVFAFMLDSFIGSFLFANFALSAYTTVALVIKECFFGTLSALESNKLTERAMKFVIFKIIFAGAYVDLDLKTVTQWFGWFAVLGLIKMYVGLCMDRFETLMSAPSARVVSHVQNIGLLLVLLAGTCWGSMALSENWVNNTMPMFLYESAVIVIDGCHMMMRCAVHLLERWRQSKLEAMAGGEQDLGAYAAWEWQGTVLYYSEFVSDVLSLVLTFFHYCHIWHLHGFSFQIIDGILLLNIRAVACSIRNRVRGFARYLAATHNLCTIFPDAQQSDLSCYGDDCAICREPMTSAKKLPCGHVFHLQCLRAWLQQSGSDNFTCPICRAPLFLTPEAGTHEAEGLAAGQPHGAAAATEAVAALGAEEAQLGVFQAFAAMMAASTTGELGAQAHAAWGEDGQRMMLYSLDGLVLDGVDRAQGLDPGGAGEAEALSSLFSSSSESDSEDDDTDQDSSFSSRLRRARATRPNPSSVDAQSGRRHRLVAAAHSSLAQSLASAQRSLGLSVSGPGGGLNRHLPRSRGRGEAGPSRLEEVEDGEEVQSRMASCSVPPPGEGAEAYEDDCDSADVSLRGKSCRQTRAAARARTAKPKRAETERLQEESAGSAIRSMRPQRMASRPPPHPAAATSQQRQ